MSNWYVRRGRERFWAKGMEQDKINAYMTLYTTLVTISKVAAPMIPFMAEQIYRNLVCSIDKSAPESVHLCTFPAYKEEWIDTKLEEKMDQVLQIVVLGRACRNTANMKQRQPLGKMYVKSETKEELSEFYREIIEEELNVKQVIFTQEVNDFTSYTFKPQLKTLGKRFGSRINALKETLSNLNGSAAMEQLNEKGTLTVMVDGVSEVLEKSDLLIETSQMEGYITNSDRGITVVLDTNLTEELIEEGYVREVISKIQTMRKDAGFEVMDHIRVYEVGNENIRAIMERNQEEIKRIVLAEELLFEVKTQIMKEWNLNGQEVELGVEKL